MCCTSYCPCYAVLQKSSLLPVFHMGITVKLGQYLHLLHYSREELVRRTGLPNTSNSKRFGPTAFQKKPTI